MAALTACMIRFCIGEDSWLARNASHVDDPGISEVCDENGKQRRNKDNKRRHKGNNSDADEVTVNRGGARIWT